MRLEGWEQRLAELVEWARSREYVLGEHDCFRFACEVIKALTGEDRWPEFAGYRTRREAMAKLAQYGSNFEDAGDWFFRRPRVEKQWAQRGDVVAFMTVDGEKHLGICLGADCCGLTDKGLVFFPTSQATCAWRVG